MFLSRDEVPAENKRESRKTRHKVVNGVGLQYKPVRLILPVPLGTRSELGLEVLIRSFFGY